MRKPIGLALLLVVGAVTPAPGSWEFVAWEGKSDQANLWLNQVGDQLEAGKFAPPRMKPDQPRYKVWDGPLGDYYLECSEPDKYEVVPRV